MTPRDGIRGDRSIRNIPVPKGHRPVSDPSHMAPVQQQYEEDFSNSAPRRPRQRRGFLGSRFFWILLSVIVICAVIGLLMSTMFAGATVTVTPRSATVAAPQSLTAQVNAPAGSLAYQVVTTTRTASTSVPASGTQQVSLPASGSMTIANTYSTASQDLVANTRFEAPDGKIYRIHANVTVPGATKAADGSLTAGTVTAIVYADKPGADYNKGATTFTIPGFKGDPKYTKFSGQAPSLSGGLVGTQLAVAPTDLANAEQALKQGLSSAMSNTVQGQIPKDLLLVSGTLNVTYNDIIQTPNSNGTATLSQTANASADVIKSQDLAAAIAKQTIQGYADEAVNFADQTQISVSAASTSTAQTGQLKLSLSGNPKLVWQFDPNALQQALVGKPKAEFETILKSFAPAISCSTATPCKASIRPFWTSNFPSTPDKISVTTGS
jgi:hypothetical protein